MELWNRFITKALIGLVLGTIVGVAFWVMNHPLSEEANSAELILHLTVSALLGMIAMGGSIVYEIESWGLLKVTLIHYVVVMMDFVIASTLLGWFERISDMLVMIAIMTVIYAGIWLTESWYWNRTVGKINEQLKYIHK
ncbi:MAG: DUF3021 domain-containing protein [Lachnospiraceae bacterium]|nr:DUF3021 domain-containing protein [Lachnospiraceae bacterium]